MRHALLPKALHSIGTLTFRSCALHARHALRSAGGGFLIVRPSSLIVIHPMLHPLTVLYDDLRPIAPMRAIVALVVRFFLVLELLEEGLVPLSCFGFFW